MNFTAKQQLLLEFVKKVHYGQFRKYTNEPYYVHPMDVARIIHDAIGDIPGCFFTEISLLHDVFEDQYDRCDEIYMVRTLRRCGYTYFDAMFITRAVIELTDIFDKKRCPHMNRSQLKACEAERLWETSWVAQTVKYADLTDNTTSIVEFDPGFARVYLVEKEYIMRGMRDGHGIMMNMCLESLTNGINKLKL